MKKRVDIALVEQGLATGRDKAKALVMAGQIYCNGQKVEKPGDEILETATLELRGNPIPFVSRGGLKLAKAIPTFGLDLKGKCCCDFGASTGGFTDCMLQNGAAKVYAFDVGYGQLAWTLRIDERVVNRERTNVRHVTEADVEQPVDFLTADLSFISLALVMPAMHRLLREQGEVVCLIKPQFEAGRDKVGKKGVVRDAKVHQEVIQTCMQQACKVGFSVRGLSFSPVRGPEGNIEYLMYLVKDGQSVIAITEDIACLVEQSHQSFVKE